MEEEQLNRHMNRERTQHCAQCEQYALDLEKLMITEREFRNERDDAKAELSEARAALERIRDGTKPVGATIMFSHEVFEIAEKALKP